MRILIDTRIWALGLKEPYYLDSDPIKPVAEQAKAFLAEHLRNDTVCISAQVTAELHHVLTARGRRLPKPEASSLITDILTSDQIEFRAHDHALLRRAVILSTQTCIHIWDFLTVLPFEGALEKIYSMDPHFRSCKELQIAPIENPLGTWAAEGRSEP